MSGPHTGAGPAATARPTRVRIRLAIVIAGLFAGLTVLGGGAGFAVGKVASFATERAGEVPVLHQEHGDHQDGPVQPGRIDDH